MKETLYDAYQTKKLALEYAKDLKITYPTWIIKVKDMGKHSGRLRYGIYVNNDKYHHNPKQEIIGKRFK